MTGDCRRKRPVDRCVICVFAGLRKESFRTQKKRRVLTKFGVIFIEAPQTGWLHRRSRDNGWIGSVSLFSLEKLGDLSIEAVLAKMG